MRARFPRALGTLRATNVIGGLQAGYNRVFPGPYLFGVEADISGTDIRSTVKTSPPGDPFAVAEWNDKVNLFGSVRTRLGYIAGPWLFYALPTGFIPPCIPSCEISRTFPSPAQRRRSSWPYATSYRPAWPQSNSHHGRWSAAPAA
jgi:hypothetical protein